MTSPSSFPSRLSVCAPAPVTRLPGSGPGPCFAGSHSPWPPPSLHRLRCGRDRFVRRLPSYYAESDFSRPCIIGYGSSPPDADRWRQPDGQSRDLPVPAQGASAHARVSDHAGSSRPRDDAPRRIAFRLMHGVGTQNRTLSRLNGWPMHAESAQGISPRAAHRSGRDTLASSGSCHRWKATASVARWAPPVARWLRLARSDCSDPPLRSTGIIPASSLLRGGPPPSPAHQYFRPHGWCRLCLFPLHRRPGSQVPYESQDESHASCTPDTAWLVSRFAAMLFSEPGECSDFGIDNVLSMLQQRFACARLSHPYMTRSCRAF